MHNRNILNASVAAGATMIDRGLGAVNSFYEPFYPFLLTAFVLIITDTWWGVRKAKIAGETIRKSRMGRAMFNKFVDYFCWTTIAALLGGTFGSIFGIPTLSAIMLSVIYSIEIDSCVSNYFAVRGFKKNISVFKWIMKKLNFEVEDTKDKKRIKHGTK